MLSLASATAIWILCVVVAGLLLMFGIVSVLRSLTGKLTISIEPDDAEAQEHVKGLVRIYARRAINSQELVVQLTLQQETTDRFGRSSGWDTRVYTDEVMVDGPRQYGKGETHEVAFAIAIPTKAKIDRAIKEINETLMSKHVLLGEEIQKASEAAKGEIRRYKWYLSANLRKTWLNESEEIKVVPVQKKRSSKKKKARKR